MQETLDALGIDWNKLISQLISFGILLFVLWRFAYKPVLDILEKRRAKIAEGLANAEKIKQEMARTQDECKAIMAEANAQADQLIAGAKQSADEQAERRIKEAAAQAENLIQKAEASMSIEREKMMAELKQEVTRLVAETTEKVIDRVLTKDDRKRLDDETVRHLAA